MKTTYKLITILFSLFFLILFIGCQNKRIQNASPEGQTVQSAPTLAGPMQQLKETLTRLLPIVIDSNQYNAPENKAQVDSDVKSLYVLSKQVVHTAAERYSDPSLRFISTAFAEEIRRAQESLLNGKREYARYTLMNVTAFCIECHTRTSSGPSFQTSYLEKTLTNMNRMERGEYLLSTRQFDRALSEFESVIKENLNSSGNLFELDRAVRYALSISIKFKQNPKKSMEIAKLIAESDRTPYYLKHSAKSWMTAIAEWSSEKSNKSKKVDDILKRCENFVGAGRTSQSGMADRGGDVYFLRALSELHLIFTNELNKEQLGRTLYLTGVSYEAVRDLSIWSLHENYFESCVRQVPHTKWSEQCYKKLEESIYFGYTGSSGVHIPTDMHVKLQELQKLALPEGSIPLK